MNQENIYQNKKVVERYHLSRSIPDHILQQYCDKIVGYIKPKTLCDVGFGRGSTLIPFATHKEVRVMGIDSSEEMGRFVVSSLNSKGLEANIIIGDAHLLSSRVDKLDLVHLKAVTHIPKNPTLFLSEVAKAIKLSGYFIIGKEYSQPEDNLENIGKYGLQNTEDKDLKRFYDHYFKIRTEDGKPFIKPQMPAGDYDDAVEHLIKNGFSLEEEIRTSLWQKEISFSELIDAIREGTFTVFSKNCTSSVREMYALSMVDYCASNNLDINQLRLYNSQLRAVILRKRGESK